MSTPWIAFDNDALKDAPRVKSGDEVFCDKCGGRHILEQTQCDGVWSDFCLVYKCGDGTYIGAVMGKLVAHTKPSASGKL
jgi:hypothetical protein